MNLADAMLACLACSKGVSDDESGDGGSPHSMVTRDNLRSLTSQLKLMAIKFSAGAYRNCKPCTTGGYATKGLPALPEGGEGTHSNVESGNTSTTFQDAPDSPDTSDDGNKLHAKIHAEEQVDVVSAGALSEIDIEDAARNGVGKLNKSHMRKTPKGDWVAQVGIGVFITFTPLSDGRNDLKRIRFSREIFSKAQAEAWWAENCAKVCEEYEVPGFGRSASAGSDEVLCESEFSNPCKVCVLDSYVFYKSMSVVERIPPRESTIGGGYLLSRMTGVPSQKPHKVAGFTSPKFTPADANDISSPGRMSNGAVGLRPKTAMVDAIRPDHGLIHEEGSEWVEEDQPGVYLTIVAMPGGRRELKRVRFSREKFREKQAEAWWKENRNRVLEQYLQ